ncbi:hypothetical protein DEO23_13265 [Brachybacterium endophyticum]|uniref:YtxH domain-containing protein n=1 Tax=Brachybacterium endophyticum TaxID=2182385 RepID=A0A2U2RI44_9MICO|nr:hypothetical protein [Brachybacterium endophyticum]PWH05530.1 hypothetical protein DEO23_13265 [Brachybacterium endophyticum]
MKKVIFLLGLVLGFFAGSRMGRGPYETLETKARELADDPTVQQKAADAKENAGAFAQRAKEKAPDVADSVKGAATGAASAVKDRATHRGDEGNGASSSDSSASTDSTAGGDAEVGDKPLSAGDR